MAAGGRGQEPEMLSGPPSCLKIPDNLQDGEGCTMKRSHKCNGKIVIREGNSVCAECGGLHSIYSKSDRCEFDICNHCGKPWFPSGECRCDEARPQ